MCIICLSLDQNLIDYNEANDTFNKIREHLDDEHEVEVATRIWEHSRLTDDEYEQDFRLLDDTDPIWVFNVDD